jgi:hypothetical protein
MLSAAQAGPLNISTSTCTLLTSGGTGVQFADVNGIANFHPTAPVKVFCPIPQNPTSTAPFLTVRVRGSAVAGHPVSCEFVAQEALGSVKRVVGFTTEASNFDRTIVVWRGDVPSNTFANLACTLPPSHRSSVYGFTVSETY